MQDEIQNLINELDLCYGPPMAVVSNCLKGLLIASPGHKLIGADFSSIEARVLAWLSREEKVLEVFRTHGKIYEQAASDIFKCDLDKVTPEQRQIGKVAVLALGYQGGHVAFFRMARSFGILLSESQIRQIKDRWRKANPNIVKFWWQLEGASVAAIRADTPQEKQVGTENRKILFLKKNKYLWCKLPSHRTIAYPFPVYGHLESNGSRYKPWTKDGLKYMAADAISHKWHETMTYGGALAENVTQALARDLLAQAMFRLEAAGYPIILHVHDEIVCEVPENFGSIKEFEEIMCVLPNWAKDLPIAAKGWEGPRYGK